jgi:hypothetical protein
MLGFEITVLQIELGKLSEKATMVPRSKEDEADHGWKVTARWKERGRLGFSLGCHYMKVDYELVEVAYVFLGEHSRQVNVSYGFLTKVHHFMKGLNHLLCSIDDSLLYQMTGKIPVPWCALFELPGPFRLLFAPGQRTTIWTFGHAK